MLFQYKHSYLHCTSIKCLVDWTIILQISTMCSFKKKHVKSLIVSTMYTPFPIKYRSYHYQFPWISHWSTAQPTARALFSLLDWPLALPLVLPPFPWQEENGGIHHKNPGSEQQKMSSSRIMGFHGQEWIRLRSLVARNYFEPLNGRWVLHFVPERVAMQCSTLGGINHDKSTAYLVLVSN